MDEAVVVGGGLAGLVASRRLAGHGVDVTLLESRDRLGGRVDSDHEDGFTFDRGFQVLFTAYPAVRRELDVDALDLHSFAPGAVIARPGQRSVLSDPLRDPRALSATVFNHELTLGDKVRVLRLRRELRRTDPEEILGRDDATVAGMLRDRGFSTGFVESFAEPFFGGITLDRSLGSARYTAEYAFKMLSEGRAALPAGGMGAVADHLAERARDAGVSVELETTVEGVDPDASGVTVQTDGETLGSDAAVLATDPRSAADLTGLELPTTSRRCVTQYFALPATQDLRTRGRLLLNAVDGRPNQVAVLSDVAPSYVPDSRTQLLSATFLGTSDRDEDTLATAVRDALSSWYPENSFDDLSPLRTDRIRFAQFAQPPGIRDRIPSPDAPEGPVVLAGDYTRWSSIQGALESGRRAVQVLCGAD